MATTDLLHTPLTATAYALAQHWCSGHQLGGRPAFEHAREVAHSLLGHAPTAPPELVAAALVHDAPDFVDVAEFDRLFTRQLGAEVARLVRGNQDLHDADDQQPQLDPNLALLGAADKIVSLRSALDRARVAGSLQEHWARHPGFVQAIPRFHAFLADAEPLIPPAMASELRTLAHAAEASTARTW